MDLNSHSNYPFSRFSIEAETKSQESTRPDAPSFEWELLSTTGSSNDVAIKVVWKPNVGGNPGVDFIVKYRLNGEMNWNSTDQIKDNDFVIILGLQLNKDYDCRVISVDGEYTAQSQILQISTKIGGKF